MIVAIESASTDPSVALAERDGTPIADDGWSGGHGQGRELLPRLLGLLAGTGRSLDGVTAIAVGTGPGSFTGLRVGMSLAKGLAVGLAVPIVGVPSLEAWLEADPAAHAALARAGAHDAFVLLRGSREPVIVAEDDLPAPARRDAVAAPRELAQAFGLSAARPPHGAATAVARLAAARLDAADDGDDLRTLEPRYLRLPRGLEALPAEPIRWL
jgi:tRNA threonylcarbamoyl adenosine modification protein YeaZ